MSLPRIAVGIGVGMCLLVPAAPSWATNYPPTTDQSDPGVPFDIVKMAANSGGPGFAGITLQAGEAWSASEITEFDIAFDIDADGEADVVLVATMENGHLVTTVEGGPGPDSATSAGFDFTDAGSQVYFNISDTDAIGDPDDATVTAIAWGDRNRNGTVDDGEFDDVTADVHFHDPTIRLAGADRFDTAIEQSNFLYDDGTASAVVLARSDHYPDALAGAPLASALDAPMLITPHDRLEPRIAAEIQRVLPAGGEVDLLGGPAALDPAIEATLHGMGYTTTRFAGANRYQTARKVCDDGLGGSDTIVVTNGLNYPDALSGGAAAIYLGACILLTQGSSSEANLDGYLQDHPDTDVWAIGGPACSALANRARCVAGVDRYGTSYHVANEIFEGANVEGGGAAVVASGESYADALGGGLLAGDLGEPLFLGSHDWDLTREIQDWMFGYAQQIDVGVVIGGTNALRQMTVHEVEYGITGFGSQ